MSVRKYFSVLLLLVFALFCQAGIPDGYYSSANGKKKAELKAALHALMQPKTVLNYGGGSGKTWSGFYKTDRREDNTVIDRYSNETHTFSNTTDAIDGMNIEHSLPKSWWGGAQNDAYKDLFNLMPCEASINTSKSNYPMGVVTNASVDNGCTKVGKGTAGTTTTNLWEPADKWKGDFARSYMYMATCYSDLTWSGIGLEQMENDDWPTLQQWAYELLLRWSREDPVDNIEKARNEAVYQIQGNRNPYVDYPNMCEYVWGDSVEYAWKTNGSPVGPTPEPESKDVVIDSIVFTKGWDGWTVKNVTMPEELSYIWSQNSSYGAKASAYVKNTNYTAEGWLISPEYDLTEYQSVRLSFSHTGKYFTDMADQARLKVTTDEGYSWSDQTINTWMTGNDWTYVINTNSLDSYAGERIHIAFCYTSSNTSAPTWEVKYMTLRGEKKTTTGIERSLSPTLSLEEGMGTVTYDCNGRRVDGNAKGILISNGKIVVR